LDRPAFSELLQTIDRVDAGGVANPICIVVERMDRLARDLMVSEILLTECRKRGVKVYAVDRGLVDMATNEGDPTQKLFRQILGALAEWEKSQTVAKLACARKRVREATGQCEGVKPYGHFHGEKELVQAAQNLFAAGSDCSAVAHSLNLAGMRTRTGKQWTRHNVRNLRGIKL
jgi:DNA invertase Pin-like site-specific DNA recombinase